MNPNSINNLSGRIAQVLYKFDASYADELSCQIGDVLQIIYKIDDQWVYVRSLMPKLDDRRFESSSSGQFPLNHLNILDIDEHVFSQKNVYIGLANFRFEADGDLDFQKGELLVCTKQIDANWLSGHYLNDPKRKGIFPVTHVAKLSLESTTDSSRSNISPKKEETNYSMPLPAKAINAFRSEDMSDFNSRRDYYLDLDFGDYLLIAARLDANWYRGENHLGKKGVFPVSCVELLSTKSGKMDGEDESNDSVMPVVLNRTQRRYTMDSLSTPDVVDDSSLFPRPIQQQLEFSEPETDNKASVINDDNTNIQFNEMILSPIEDDKNIIITKTNSTTNVNVNETEKVTKCVVNFDFVSETIDDLSCKSGEMLKVVGEINTEWLRCTNESGRTGMVPAAFVTILGGDDWSMALSDERHQDLSTPSRDHQVVEVAPYRPVRPPPPPPSPAAQQPLKRLMSQSSSSLALLSPPPLPPPPPPALPPPLLAKQRFNLTNASSSLSNLSSPADSTKCSTYKPRKAPMPPSAKHNNGSAKSDDQTANNVLFQDTPKSHEETVSESAKREKNRLLTIQELIQTESDYFIELSLCYDVFMTTNDEQHLSDGSSTAATSEFNREALFSKLKPIIDVSKSLVEAFDAELRSSDNNPLKMRVSSCLMRVANQMQYPYAEYARANNDVNILVKKYEENPIIQEYINTRLGEIKSKIKSIPHLASILIKPVQRIAKYPLFLTQLIKVTDKTDAEYNRLNEALTTYTEMLEFINEFKRRKDLVDKYLKGNENSIMDLMKKINMKSLKKKSNRLSIQLSNKLGLSNQHVFDDNFLRVEEEFRFVEKSVKNFATDLNSYLANFKEVLDYEKNMFTDMLFIFDDEFQLYSKFESGANARRSIDYHDYSNQVIHYVLNPLNILGNCFNGPNTLINKRTHKLLDYEGALADYEFKSTQTAQNASATLSRDITTHLDRTKKDYEALNSQLIEELPLLTQKAVKLFTLCVKKFVIITDKFLRLVVNSIRQIMNETQFEQVSSQQTFDENRRVSQLIRVRTINEKFERPGTSMSSTSSSGSSFQQTTERPTTSVNLQLPNDHTLTRQQRSTSMIPSYEFHFSSSAMKNLSRPTSDSSSSSSIGLPPLSPVRPQSTLVFPETASNAAAPIQTEEQRQKLLEKYPLDEIYVVTQKYIANEKLCQLKSNINDLVAMLKPYDPAQQTHIWFVDTGAQRGFMPANALTPYSQLYNTSNLINLDEESTAATSSKRNSQNTTKSSNSSTSGLDEAAVASALVDILDEFPPPPPTPQFCIALYDLKAPASNTIDLVRNQKYRVLEKCDKRGDPEWWLVESMANGLRGYVPKNYIRIV